MRLPFPLLPFEPPRFSSRLFELPLSFELPLFFDLPPSPFRFRERLRLDRELVSFFGVDSFFGLSFDEPLFDELRCLPVRSLEEDEEERSLVRVRVRVRSRPPLFELPPPFPELFDFEESRLAGAEPSLDRFDWLRPLLEDFRRDDPPLEDVDVLLVR